MVTRLASLLLRVAAQRWPADVCDDLHREWLAELHVLAQQDRPMRTLAFASSLLFARPAHTRAVAFDRRLWNTFLHLMGGLALTIVMLVLPLIAYAIVGGAFIGFVNGFKGTDSDGFYYLIPACWVLWLAELWLLARTGRRWGERSVANGLVLLTLVLVVTLPLAPLFIASRGMDAMIAGISVLLPGLGLVLYTVGKLARAGRVRAAWLVGLVSWVVLLDVAAIAPFLPLGSYPGLDYSLAPLWMPSVAFDIQIDKMPIVPVSQALFGMPQMWLFLCVFGMSYVIGAVQPTATSETVPSLAPAPR